MQRTTRPAAPVATRPLAADDRVQATPLVQSWLWWSERPGSSPADRC